MKVGEGCMIIDIFRALSGISVINHNGDRGPDSFRSQEVIKNCWRRNLTQVRRPIEADQESVRYPRIRVVIWRRVNPNSSVPIALISHRKHFDPSPWDSGLYFCPVGSRVFAKKEHGGSQPRACSACRSGGLAACSSGWHHKAMRVERVRRSNLRFATDGWKERIENRNSRFHDLSRAPEIGLSSLVICCQRPSRLWFPEQRAKGSSPTLFPVHWVSVPIAAHARSPSLPKTDSKLTDLRQPLAP